MKNLFFALFSSGALLALGKSDELLSLFAVATEPWMARERAPLLSPTGITAAALTAKGGASDLRTRHTSLFSSNWEL